MKGQRKLLQDTSQALALAQKIIAEKDAEIKCLKDWLEEMKMTAESKYKRIQASYKKDKEKGIPDEKLYAVLSGAWSCFILWLTDRKHIQESQEYWAANREEELAHEIQKIETSRGPS